MFHESPSRRGGSLRAALLVLVIAGGVPVAQGFRQDEIECEEATAVLADCCPDFDPHVVDCEYVAGCEDSTYPSITPDESQCIRDMSCSELREAGVCDRVLARETADTVDTGGEVCP